MTESIKHLTNNESIARDMWNRYDIFLMFKELMCNVVIGQPDECWLWKGKCGKRKAYFSWEKKRIYFAPIASYICFKGRISKRLGKKALKVCHTCDNPKCINPNHLWLGTQKENIQDCIAKGRRGTLHFKLNKHKANKIRKLYKSSEYTYKELAKKFNVSVPTINIILQRKIWK